MSFVDLQILNALLDMEDDIEKGYNQLFDEELKKD